MYSIKYIIYYSLYDDNNNSLYDNNNNTNIQYDNSINNNVIMIM